MKESRTVVDVQHATRYVRNQPLKCTRVSNVSQIPNTKSPFPFAKPGVQSLC